MAKKHGLPVLAIVGSVGDEFEKVIDKKGQGIDAVIPVSFNAIGLRTAEQPSGTMAYALVAQASEQALRCNGIGIGIGANFNGRRKSF